ncbi:MFS-type transporter SLC18B1 isoform X2 [Pleurodeles waltl]|uniref:MFS-type transporter SLC18B1 isoform X2 n=1 Tax=Pleurodeles waltl TaxID=8319 RepID=UPI003709C219
MEGGETGPETDDTLTDGQRQDEFTEEPKRISRTQIFTLISCASINFSSMIIYSVLAPFFPLEAVKKGVSNTFVGLIFGCFALFNFISSLVLGKYLVEIGAKFMFLAGMFSSGVATILFGMLDKAADGTPFIVLCFVVRAVDAIGFGAAMTASFSILAKAFPNNIATVLGTLEIFTGLGLVLGPPIGGFLYQTFGYEIPFIALGSLVLLMMPLNMYILPRYDAVPGRESFWRLFTLPKILFICLLITSMSSCMGFLDPTVSLFVTEKFHLPVGHVGLVFLGLALSYALSSPLLGLISDKKPIYGRQVVSRVQIETLHRGVTFKCYLTCCSPLVSAECFPSEAVRKWLVVIGCLGTAICFVLLGPAPFLHIESVLWLFVLTLVILGIFLGLTAIPIFPEMLSCAYENGFQEGLSTLGLISGLFSSMWSIGGFIGPTLGGFLNDKFNFEWASAMQGAASLAVGLSVGIFYIRESLVKKGSVSRNILHQGKPG